MLDVILEVFIAVGAFAVAYLLIKAVQCQSDIAEGEDS